MPPRNLGSLRRTRIYDGQEFVAVEPGLAIQLFTTAALEEAARAVADVLEAYLAFVPPGSIRGTFHVGGDEYDSGFVPYGRAEHDRLMAELCSFVTEPDDEIFDFVLCGTEDGQASQYGFRFRGTTVSDPIGYPDDSSLVRLELPWDLLDRIEVTALLDFVRAVADRFPWFTGHVGLSFINTVAYETVARDEIPKLVPRFLGFDTAYDWMRVHMRGKVPPPHWVHLLDDAAIDRLGGAPALRTALSECEVTDLPGGALVRAAKYPPVGDVNRKALDLGQVPRLAQVFAPILYDVPRELGLGKEEVGQAYLERFDGRPAMPWDNG